MVPVPEFMTGYLNQHAQEMQDQGYDDYTAPDVAQYVECDKFEINGRYYYMMLGCSDESTKKIAVNIYEDEYCTKRSSVDGYDDANIDVSNIQVRCCKLLFIDCFCRKRESHCVSFFSLGLESVSLASIG